MPSTPDLNHDSNPTEALTLDYGWKWLEADNEIAFDWAHVAPAGTGYESGTFEDVSLDIGDPNAGPNAQRYASIRQSVREALDLRFSGSGGFPGQSPFLVRSAARKRL